jgi:hypothetical protein
MTSPMPSSQIPDLQTGVEKMLNEDRAGMKKTMKPSKMG